MLPDTPEPEELVHTTARGADCGQLMSREPRPPEEADGRASHTALSSPLRLILMPFTSPSRDPRVPRRLPKLEGVAAPAAPADDAALSALGRDGDGPRGGIVARTVEEREAAGNNTWGGGAEGNEAEDRYLVPAYPYSVTVVAVMADARLDVVREKEAAARRPPQASSLDCCGSAPVIRSARGNARKGDASGLWDTGGD